MTTITQTIAINGLAKVNARSAWHPRVTAVPVMTQKIFFPVLSMQNPDIGDATAERM